MDDHAVDCENLENYIPQNSYAYGSLDVESVFSDQAINIRTTETFVFSTYGTS